MFQLVEILLS